MSSTCFIEPQDSKYCDSLLTIANICSESHIHRNIPSPSIYLFMHLSMDSSIYMCMYVYTCMLACMYTHMYIVWAHVHSMHTCKLYVNTYIVYTQVDCIPTQVHSMRTRAWYGHVYVVFECIHCMRQIVNFILSEATEQIVTMLANEQESLWAVYIFRLFYLYLPLGLFYCVPSSYINCNEYNLSWG